MSDEKKFDSTKGFSESKAVGMFAKKDFVINQNGFHLVIKKGDDVSKVPQAFLQNLKTEGVL